GQPQMPVSKGIEHVRLVLGRSDDRQAVWRGRAMSRPVRALLGAQTRQIAAGQFRKGVRSLEVRSRVQAAELGGAADSQPTAQGRGHELPFAKDQLSLEGDARIGERAVVTALAFQ